MTTDPNPRDDGGGCWDPHDTQGKSPAAREATMRQTGWIMLALAVTVAALAGWTYMEWVLR